MALTPITLAARLDRLTIRDRQRLAGRLERLRRRNAKEANRELERIAGSIDAAEAMRAARAAGVPPVTYPAELPVSGKRDEILAAIRTNQVVVVAGETGSGKTTQIPKMCLELGRGVDGMIGHTQPRRIAARSVAERLAEELSVPLGSAVGYAVRFTDVVSDTTLVKVMTDGILLAEIRHDRTLTAYDTIIVDEAHERSLNIDFLLGYLTRLLPRRPDLKVIVTSATIDTARFAAHFGAPVVEVSGRTYPVDIRYRPIGDEDGSGDGDPNDALCDAVGELLRDTEGDVLAFLPGERDIRDAASALRSSGYEEVEILPLYARLSAAEQHRVFRPHRRRRVVLATNVAETSLTVPGIRSVVDTGLARVSRFSRRTKVQRLPIERVSRASADQRAGRCGRLAAGVCIRLYSEDDYAGRPEFTDPEILRTNLASVILQMADIGLGEIEDFPFLEPPDRRSIADGRALLEELGAFRPHEGRLRLTSTGRRLAQLPLDPRLGRMVLEAERLDCLREMTVIAAAMSIQDPRERPEDRQEEAERLHRRFVVTDSDFLGFVKLWDYLAGLQAETSGNQFRRRCRAEHLNVLRIREWQDVAGQIREVYRSQGIHANREAAPPALVHQALAAGLLSHIGMRDPARSDYRGARNTRWQISRISALARHPPAWAVAGALVETERTWARTVARVEPAWIEKAGTHLAHRTYAEPWWDPDRGEAATSERVTVYGLPVVADRRVSLTRVDPAEARRMFVRRALVERDWKASISDLERNDALIEHVHGLEERARRRDLFAGEDVIYDFYDARIPSDVSTGRRFERWWAKSQVSDPDLLRVPLDLLMNPEAGPILEEDYPDRWVQDDIELALRYRFEPGSPDDGVTAAVPLLVLNRLSDAGFDWHVPGYRSEIVHTLIRSLPKAIRRTLGPTADVAREVVAQTGVQRPQQGRLLDAVARAVSRMTGQRITPDVWREDVLPDHLRMLFEVVDDQGEVLARGRDLGRLREELGGQVRAAIARLAPELERHGVIAWEFPDLPRRIERGMARGYPSLVDEGTAVGVAILDSAAAQADSMWHGTRRLLVLSAPLSVAHLQRTLSNDTKFAISASPFSLVELLDDCAAATAEAIMVSHGGPAFERDGFDAMATDARATLADRTRRLATIAGGVLAGAEGIEERLAGFDRAGAGSSLLATSLADIRGQVADLVRPGFVAAAGVDRLPNLLRYLDAAGRRLDRLPRDLRRDRERQALVDRVRERYEQRLDQVAAGRMDATSVAGLASVRWMIEELRVSLWAQQLGTPAPVSAERISRFLDDLGS